ncbi:MAG: hypothetical protein WCH44_10480 [Betaproteobacteria bacterium]
MARMQESSKKEWASKVLALVKGGNTTAALNQIKVAPSVKDLKQLQAALILAKLQPAQPAVDTVIADQIDALTAPRLHRSP